MDETKKAPPPKSHELQAQEFWNSTSPKQQDMAHWRGVGRYARISEWNRIGEFHLAMLRRCRETHGFTLHEREPADPATGLPCRQRDNGEMLEWGPGGGANFNGLAELFDRGAAVDISVSTLSKCLQTIKDLHPDFNLDVFPIAADRPEDALVHFGADRFDFVICTAVVQHMPTREYVAHVLRILSKMAKPGADAIIQHRVTKNISPKMWRRSRNKPYKDNVARWMLYQKGEFDQELEDNGWEILENAGPADGGKSGYVYHYCKAKR